MKIKNTILYIAVGFGLPCYLHAQGALTPSSAPAPTQKSLQEIWDKLNSLSESIPQLAHQSIPPISGMVAVVGGKLPANSTMAGQEVSTFYIGKYEVTWEEWELVRDWAASNGYTDLSGVGTGVSNQHPVRYLNWYDCIKWCNARSEKEGLTPVYTVNGTVYRAGNFGENGSSAINQNLNANGYRLPSESEWEWANRGGLLSKGYSYSGSNDPSEVGWYVANSSDTDWPVGQKKPNELGIFDMMGNVVEWCWSIHSEGRRRLRGASFDAHPAFVWDNLHSGPPDSYYFNQGFRVARSYK